MGGFSLWGQKRLREVLGPMAMAIPTMEGPQEAVVAKVTTEVLQLAGLPAASYHVVYVALPNTFGDGPGFGPCVYQPVPGWTPSVGDPCLIEAVGNGVGHLYVTCFPSATPT